MDKEVILEMIKAVAATATITIFALDAGVCDRYDRIVVEAEQILASNYSLMFLYLTSADLQQKAERYNWITNRNAFYQHQQRFKAMKPATTE